MTPTRNSEGKDLKAVPVIIHFLIVSLFIIGFISCGAQQDQNITNTLGMEFVNIEPGTFMMGSSSSEPHRNSNERQHQVKLTKGYYMQTTEVTQGQWRAVMGNSPSYFKNCGENCPVEQVSWDDARKFIRKLSKSHVCNVR